jgi:mannose-6-phosphate isomerase-like protein (cupin superfamily)
MNRIFSIKGSFRVPDGTLVSPFLNAKDSQSGLPFDLIDGFSIAAGEIEPRKESKIHIMPHVTQVTFVRRGSIQIHMRDPGTEAKYEVPLQVDQAVITRPGTFFQLENKNNESCHVLYIVSPAYIFLADDAGSVIYDDAIVLDESWSELKAAGWESPKMKTSGVTKEARDRAIDRLAARSRSKDPL